MDTIQHLRECMVKPRRYPIQGKEYHQMKVLQGVTFHIFKYHFSLTNLVLGK